MSSDYPDYCLFNQGTRPDETAGLVMYCREVSGEIVMSIQGDEHHKQAVQKFEHEKKEL